jgi:hypothetical protein
MASAHGREVFAKIAGTILTVFRKLTYAVETILVFLDNC